MSQAELDLAFRDHLAMNYWTLAENARNKADLAKTPGIVVQEWPVAYGFFMAGVRAARCELDPDLSVHPPQRLGEPGSTP